MELEQSRSDQQSVRLGSTKIDIVVAALDGRRCRASVSPRAFYITVKQRLV
jgi:hypothetical protein